LKFIKYKHVSLMFEIVWDGSVWISDSSFKLIIVLFLLLFECIQGMSQNILSSTLELGVVLTPFNIFLSWLSMFILFSYIALSLIPGYLICDRVIGVILLFKELILLINDGKKGLKCPNLVNIFIIRNVLQNIITPPLRYPYL
jgi:hypothetical protein